MEYINIFLQNKANDINEDVKNINKFLPFYYDISNDDLAYLFAYMHFKLNNLFKFMNTKMRSNGHYNAHESRELIAIIDLYKQLKNELRNSNYAFILDEYYLQILNKCESFLEESGGSSIPEDMNIINIYESKPTFKLKHISSPIDNIITFDETEIHKEWEKALKRKSTDPEGAITTARTLLESLLKYILDEKDIEYGENIDLSELYKKVSKSLNLSPEQHNEQIFKQILGGANGIVSGLGSLRNKLGDAHGKGQKKVKPKERHSELAVNLAGSIAIFLYKTFKENKETK